MQDKHGAKEAQPHVRDDEDSKTFDVAPVSLWLHDYSALKALFADWKAAGITDLREFLREDPDRIKACSERFRVIKVNRRTLTLFEANDLTHLVENLGRVFRDDMFHAFVDELVQLWEGRGEFVSHSVNYTLSGRRLEIDLKGRVLPGHERDWSRVLVALEDVTARESARRALALSEQYARGLFEHSPVSLWVEDFSSIKRLMDEIRCRGITDLRVFTDVHPEFVSRCMSEIRVVDVNKHTLSLFGAPDKGTLLSKLSDVFRDDMQEHFREQLVDLWQGKLFQQREVVNYALDGSVLHFHLQFSVLPGHEYDWSLVQVALTDITARKKAESYLSYLGTHDVLTGLKNRSFFEETLVKLQQENRYPVSIVIIDINGLKKANDSGGHEAGDALIRRAASVLTQAASDQDTIARIGGDEFAMLLSYQDERAARNLVAQLNTLVGMNNQFHGGIELSMSIGSATAYTGMKLTSVLRTADERMYAAKRAYYEGTGDDRRAPRVA